jgi:hypothetical protein
MTMGSHASLPAVPLRLGRSWRWSHESQSLGSASLPTIPVLAYFSHAIFGQIGLAALGLDDGDKT